MNNLELKSVRFRGDKFCNDFVIDGLSLRSSLKVGDFISPFGWLPDESEIWFANNFLLKNDSELEDSRYQILVCSECADLGCGALTAKITKNFMDEVFPE